MDKGLKRLLGSSKVWLFVIGFALLYTSGIPIADLKDQFINGLYIVAGGTALEDFAKKFKS